MPDSDKYVCGPVEQWVAKAEDDFGVAEILRKTAAPYQAIICFHCQQAVEKLLKAYLTAHQIEFEKTHSIGRLLDLAETVDAQLASALADTTRLTPFAAQMRYPGDMPEPDAGESQALFEITSKAREILLRQIVNAPKPKITDGMTSNGGRE